ncbi:MAG: CopD family protein [Armatimonadota bacterium]|nr:CopD family protein [Armatimonadota bacterium]MDR7475904.1 CopD family protein [Armatimonadota bacterium]
MLRLRLGLAVAALAAAVTVWVPPGWGHGVLEWSTPPAGAGVDRSPPEVLLRFSEAVDASLSSAKVLDAQGAVVSGESSVSEDRRTLRVVLPPLKHGLYTVRWQILWSRDGHITRGALVFGVGQRPEARGLDEARSVPDPIRLASRWLGLAGSLVLAGSHLFGAVAWPGAVPLGPSLAVTVGATLAVLSGVLLEFLREAADLLGESLARRRWTAALALVPGTNLGWSVLVRTGSAVLLLASHLLGRAALPSPHLTRVQRALAAALLGGIPLRSHAWAEGPVAVAADWFHLIGASGLVGGWAGFLDAVMRAPAAQRAGVAKAVLPRVSALLSLSFAVLLITGVYASFAQVGSLPGLFETSYGRLLLAKLALVAIIAALGVVNRYRWMPRLAASPLGTVPAELRSLVRSIGAEIACAGTLLGLVAALAVFPPPRGSLSVSLVARERALILAGQAGQFWVRLAVVPARPGWNRFQVELEVPAGSAFQRETRVLLWITKLDDELQPQRVLLTPVGPRLYQAEGSHLSLPGWWQVEVVVRQRGQPDRSTVFPLPLGELPLRPSDPVAARWLEEVAARAARFDTWREVQQVSDGAGGVEVAQYEFAKPERMRYRTASGLEVVVVGTARFVRKNAGPWRRETLAEPLSVRGPLNPYIQAAEGVVLGRSLPCEGESCRVVLWETGAGRFAALVGERSRRLHRLFMVAPSHFMTLHSLGPGVNVRIRPPE